jgi:hypothetical protein
MRRLPLQARRGASRACTPEETKIAATRPRGRRRGDRNHRENGKSFDSAIAPTATQHRHAGDPAAEQHQRRGLGHRRLQVAAAAPSAAATTAIVVVAATGRTVRTDAAVAAARIDRRHGPDRFTERMLATHALATSGRQERDEE